MFVFIAHAEADQGAADDLKTFLRTRGLVAETETAARGFRHLQASDVVIALWSQKAVFGAQRMMMERRMLDAWADGRLVLVKLDHGFLPVGLRDLPAIDASFESGRSLSVWPQVERAAREAMNRALVEKQGGGAPPSPPRERMGVGSGGSPPSAETTSEDPWSTSRSAPSAAPEAPPKPSEQFRSRRGSPAPGLLVLAVLGTLGWAGWQLFGEPTSSETLDYVAYGAAALGAIVLLALLVWALAPKPHKKVKAAAGQSGVAAAPGPAENTPPPGSLFISYAHADGAAVEPVVKAVRANGREVWIDKTGLQTGDGWAGEIVRAIKGAKGMMVMCSPRAFESDHIKREVYLADRYKKPMLPVFLEPAQMPEDFEYFFAGVQLLELFRLADADRPGAIGKALSAV